MAKNKKAKRPRSAKYRTLPPDAASLEVMFRSVHRHLLERADHLKKESHDYHARRGLLSLYETRAAAWSRLLTVAPHAALRLASEFNLIIPEVA